MKLISLFSGIGAFEKALTNLGIEHEVVHYCEIDKYAAKAYSIIHGVDESKNLGDITKIDIEKLPGEIDLLTHGSPCQDFSIAGKGLGADGGTRSSLMWNSVEIIRHCRPKFVIWENVKNVLSKKHKHNFDKYINELEKMGYKNYYQVLNAKNYGIPQNRERIFCISILGEYNTFKFPTPFDGGLRLKDFLDATVDEKYYISQNRVSELISRYKDGKQGTLPSTNECLSSSALGSREHRARGWSDDVSTLCARDYKDPKIVSIPTVETNKLIKTHILDGGKWDKIHESARRVYSQDGIVPTIPTCQGGNIEPKVSVRVANKKGYDLATVGDSINIEQPSSTTRRGRVGHGVAQTLNTGCHQVTLECDYKIRKLTPLECWRLMGFSDEDFHKVSSEGISNSQLYKMAGNSIVVNVLMEIYKNLLF